MMMKKNTEPKQEQNDFEKEPEILIREVEIIIDSLKKGKAQYMIRYQMKI